MEIKLNREQALESVIQAYKQACIAYEVASKLREEIKEQILETVEYKEGIYGDLTITKINPEPSFNWKALLEEYHFEAKKIAKFYKEKDSYLRVILKRNIVI